MRNLNGEKSGFLKEDKILNWPKNWTLNCRPNPRKAEFGWSDVAGDGRRLRSSRPLRSPNTDCAAHVEHRKAE